MRIKSEFVLIDDIAKILKVRGKNIVKGISDDCAVVKIGPNKYSLISTDMLVENNHFRLDWSSAWEIGKKLVEINVSDIVAMGGIPLYAFISIGIPKNTDEKFIKQFYRGIDDASKKYKLSILGGDTNRSELCVFNLAIIGETDGKHLSFRSTAKNRDLICVTGTLGKSEVGLRLLKKGEKGFKAGYLKPQSRLPTEGRLISQYSNSMIDVSDGLFSEINHICNSSKLGAKIFLEKIPISKQVRKYAAKLKDNPLDYALFGGEDYELLFTIAKQNLNKLKNRFKDFSIIGEMYPQNHKLKFYENGIYKRLNKLSGFDHFK